MTRVGSDEDERSVDEENVYNKKARRLYLFSIGKSKTWIKKEKTKRGRANTQ